MLKYVLWIIFTKFVMGVVYLAVISEGLRQLFPPVCQKLYKLPGFAILYRFPDLRRLDLAPFLAGFILLAVFFSWERILLVYLGGDKSSYRETSLLVLIGTIILGADGFLFYTCVTQMSWSDAEVSIPGVLMTTAYVALLVWISYVTVTLKMKVRR